jgi:hypothetical protein
MEWCHCADNEQNGERGPGGVEPSGCHVSLSTIQVVEQALGGRSRLLDGGRVKRVAGAGDVAR